MAAKKRATKKSKASKHIAYNGTNFSKILPHFKGGPAVVINILVHMDGCGPCQRLMGPYKKAVSKAPSDAVNVSVERQKLEKFNEDLRSNVSGASTLEAPSFPHIIKVDNSGKVISTVTPSPSNIGSLTSNSENFLNNPTDVPGAESQGPMEPPSGEGFMNIDDDSAASIYNNTRANSPIMSGGRAYAILSAAGHRLRKSKKTGRKTRKTNRRS
jgi:hypothetical protein